VPDRPAICFLRSYVGVPVSYGAWSGLFDPMIGWGAAAVLTLPITI